MRVIDPLCKPFFTASFCFEVFANYVSYMKFGIFLHKNSVNCSLNAYLKTGSTKTFTSK